ncbi:hypothetical protein NIES2111_58250 (plasmid) [Nostoc sp. NIES-2111]|nr:hypothetical protein NIES2111_58250 [Nostoc sp. NIES-2111]
MSNHNFGSIFQAVCDGSQREWTDEEKALVLSNPLLLNQLQGWLESNLSDGCWHSANYKLIQPKSCIANSNTFSADADIHIPF